MPLASRTTTCGDLRPTGCPSFPLTAGACGVGSALDLPPFRLSPSESPLAVGRPRRAGSPSGVRVPPASSGTDVVKQRG